jgi:hypothetical protein
MAKIFDNLNDKKGKDIRVLADFIAIFCRENHREEAKDMFPIKDARLRDIMGDNNLKLCPDCRKLLNHGIAKLLLCPYDPKPTCKDCQTQCYAPGYRERIQEVMRFSSLFLIKHGGQ